MQQRRVIASCIYKICWYSTCLGNIVLVLQTVQNHLSSIECICVHYILSRDVLLFL